MTGGPDSPFNIPVLKSTRRRKRRPGLRLVVAGMFVFLVCISALLVLNPMATWSFIGGLLLGIVISTVMVHGL